MMNLTRLSILLLVPFTSMADGLPLFDSDEPLSLTIEAPLRTLIRDAVKRPTVDGTATYTDADGKTVSLAVQMSTRGRSRLTVCKFPPLSFNIKRKAAAETIFEGQKSLKMVTHCQSHVQFRSYFYQEYGVYKAFNALTDVSFRVRMLNVTYRDSEGKMKDFQESAFFIESIGEIAKRNGLERQRVQRVDISQLDPSYATLATMFQFFVGNTDWSVKLAPDEADCCHNGRVLSEPEQQEGWMVVPYDFDQTGIINPRYAEPAEQLGIRSVRQRLWRGRCVHSSEVDAVIAIFNDKRNELEDALIVDGVRDHKSARSYIDLFYKTINDAKKRKRYIDDKCLAS